MKQFTMRLREEFQRPVMYLQNLNIDVLLDTGSLFPVWCAGEQTLKEIGGIKISDYAPFGGFGGSTSGKLYELEILKIGDLLFPHIKIISCEYPSMIVPLIVSATMFDNLIYEINNKTHCLTVTVPDDESNIRNFNIRNDKGQLYVLCASAES